MTNISMGLPVTSLTNTRAGPAAGGTGPAAGGGGGMRFGGVAAAIVCESFTRCAQVGQHCGALSFMPKDALRSGAAAPPRAASLGAAAFFLGSALFFLPWPLGGARPRSPKAPPGGGPLLSRPHDNMYGSVDILGSATPQKLLPITSLESDGAPGARVPGARRTHRRSCPGSRGQPRRPDGTAPGPGTGTAASLGAAESRGVAGLPPVAARRAVPQAGTMRALLASLLPALAAAQCATRIRVGTFGDANPEALAVMTDWLNDDPNECWTFYRQPSGGLSIAKLDSGDLDIALLGSTPYAAAAARRGRLKAVSVAHLKGESQALITRARFDEPKALSSDTIKAGGTAKATLATPKTSTAHYIALAVIANAGLDLGKIDLVFMSPSEITAAWDSGEIDGACVWGTAFSHLLNNPWGGSADRWTRATSWCPLQVSRTGTT